MKILIHVPSYYPAIGGVETATMNLVEQLTALGQQVVVLTRTSGYMPSPTKLGRGGYRIVFNASKGKLLRWTCWCDIIVHANVNMRTLWPLFIVRRPWVVIHHHRLCNIQHSALMYTNDLGKIVRADSLFGRYFDNISINDRVKRFCAKYADLNIAVSSSLAEGLPFPTLVLPNCHDHINFRLRLDGRTALKNVIFVGRFVSEKGHWLLFEALQLLRREGIFLKGSFVGDGPMRVDFQKNLLHSELSEDVKWIGTHEGADLAAILAEHKVCVIPSVVAETFGLIALEAMACGCAVVSANDGAVPWVAGQAGLTFESGNVRSLADVLRKIHEDGQLLRELQSQAKIRALAFSPIQISKHYLRALQNIQDVSNLCYQANNSKLLRILVVSPFFPNVGGIETVFRLLIREWESLGHEVKVIHPIRVQYHSSCLQPPDTAIYYSPSVSTAMALHHWCDIVMHGSLNMRFLPYLIFSGKPCIVTQHGSVTHNGILPLSVIQRLKRWVSKRLPNITCSKFVAEDLGLTPLAIGNPYQDDIFFMRDGPKRDKDLIFVGRIVSDKGLPLLLRALHKLQEQYMPVNLTVIGTGSEMTFCQNLVNELGIKDKVIFLGVMSAADIADQLRQHKVLVVPSSFWEPFGIVALEGIACGCIVVASKRGGMGESVGPCGILYENNSLNDLVRALREGMALPAVDNAVRNHHLAQFRSSAIAEKFLTVIRMVIADHLKSRPFWRFWMRKRCNKLTSSCDCR